MSNSEPTLPNVPESVPADVPVSHVEDVFFTNKRLHLSVRGILAIVVITTTCVMALRQAEVKEPLYSLAIFVLGFYFGTRGVKR